MNDNSSALRGCVFIDSSNPELPNQIMNHSSHPFIKPPFPPLIDPKDLLIISKDNKPSRSPNAFIIYRKVFLKTTRDQGYFLPMTIVSSMASKSWDQESEEVRSYYKRLAKEAYKYRTEQFPKKVKRRRRKEPWKTNNIVFQNDLQNTFSKSMKSTENSSSSSPTLNLKNETPIISPDMFSLSNNDNFSPNSSPNLEQQFNETSLFHENEYQELFSSPNLSNNSSIMPSPIMNEITITDNSEYNNNNNNSDEPFCSQNPEFNLQNDLELEIYNQNLANLWQQLLLNQNNFTDTTISNEINYPDYHDYNGYNGYNDYNNYYATNFTADLLNQEVLGISYNNPIENVSYL